MPRPRAPSEPTQEPAGYGELLEDLKSRIRSAQVRAALAVNRELIELYWDIGRTIVERQRREEWGSSVIERLSRDLRAAFPDAPGFSPRNLWRIRAFYLAWSEPEILPQQAADTALHFPIAVQSAILPQPVAEIAAEPQSPAAEELFSLLPEIPAEIFTLAAPFTTPDVQTVILPQPVAEIPSSTAEGNALPARSVILPQAVAEIPPGAADGDTLPARSVILPQAVAEILSGSADGDVLPARSVILPQAVAEIQPGGAGSDARSEEGVILPQLVAEIPWGHNVALLEKVSTRTERLWYARMAARHGWSRNVLVHQIETGLYGRSGQAVTNFDRTIPAAESELLRELLKDPYHFGFLQLGPAVQERDLERALLSNVQKLLMELGLGFALIGSQYHLEVGGQDYYLDLLFYHINLRRYVVVELKIGAFQPEDAGKMNFYLAAVDDLVRNPEHEPSIGLILCKERNRVVAEYALGGSTRPIGVAQYRVTGLPEPLQASLPSLHEIERRLEGENPFEP